MVDVNLLVFFVKKERSKKMKELTKGIFVEPSREKGGASLLDLGVELDGAPAIKLFVAQKKEEKKITIWLSSKLGSSEKKTNGLRPGQYFIFDHNGKELKKNGSCAECGAPTYKMYDYKTDSYFQICSAYECPWLCASQQGALPRGIITP